MLYRFEDCALDLARGCLRVADQEVDLRPKSFDVLRYLIENAGRLIPKEEIIKAVWTNVVVTDESLMRCISEVRAAIGDRDQRIVRTVPRRGYLFTATVTREQRVEPVGQDWASAAGPERELPDRPSIAVLPFTNLSGDPQQEYFSDGVTEDIITELSRFSELFVIARNSSFQYKGKAVDIRQVGRELGVRYVLEGSIQRASDRVRIGAQLIDAVTGGHRWAERYDRELKDVFAIQDEVARAIAAILAAHVNKAEMERTLLKPPATWQAYDYFKRGTDIFFSIHTSFNAETLYEARRLLERSLSIDPDYARACAWLSDTYVFAAVQPLDGDYLNPAALDEGYRLAARAVQLDPTLPQAHAQLGAALTWKHQHDASISAFERAIALNPNFTDWRFGMALILAGDAARAIQHLEANMRFDPFYMPLARGCLGWAHYMLKRYSEALPMFRECASRAPKMRAGHLWLAATYAQLGQLEAARAEAGEVLRIEPKFTIDGTARLTIVFKSSTDAEHYFDGLRKAGLPES